MIPSGLTPVTVESTLAERVFLRERDGQERWLHLSGTMLTLDRAYRWQGTTKQAVAIKRQSKVARDLVAIRAPTPPKPQEAYK